MPSIETIASILASLVSVGAGVWSLFEARRSAKSASKAESVKEELIDRKHLVEMSNLHKETERILSKLSAIGPSARVATLQSVDLDVLFAEIIVYSDLIASFDLRLDEAAKEHARLLNADPHKYMTELSDTVTSDSYKQSGTALYLSVQNFLPIAKNIADFSWDSVNTEKYRG